MAHLQVVCFGCGRSVDLVVVMPTAGIPHDCARPMPGSDHPTRHVTDRVPQGTSALLSFCTNRTGNLCASAFGACRQVGISWLCRTIREAGMAMRNAVLR